MPYMSLCVVMTDWGNLRDQIFPRTGFAPSAARGHTARTYSRSDPQRGLVKEEVEEEEVASAPAVAIGTGPLKKRRAWACSGDSVGDSRWTPAEEARLPRALPVLDRQWTGADPTI